MGKSRKKPKPTVDWERVRELRMRCYGARGGSVELSPDETALLLAAIEEDSERYRELGDEAKEYHWEPIILQWYRSADSSSVEYEDIFGTWDHIAEEPPESEVACTGPSPSPEPEPPRVLSALERVWSDP